MLKIAFLTTSDPRDRCSGSASFYYMAQALQHYCGEVTCLGPLQVKEQLLGKVINRGARQLLKKRFPYYNSCWLARRYARAAAQRLQERSYDVIVSPFGTVNTAFLETATPIVLVEDATFALLHNYYPGYSVLFDRAVKEGRSITYRAFQKAAALVFSSAWAARSAIDDYGVVHERVQVIPFGANIEQAPARQTVEQRQRSPSCKLLFVGVNWERKGGDIAFETLLSLEKLGLSAELTVCGCKPPPSMGHQCLKVVPFLNGNDPGQRQELEQLYWWADFLLLPTRGDCTPFVFCEASAFGLPVITADTGGIREVIRDGINGFVLPYEARGEAYARVIKQVFDAEEGVYKRLSTLSRATFEACLNWDAWGSAMQLVLERVVGDRRREQEIDPSCSL